MNRLANANDIFAVLIISTRNSHLIRSNIHSSKLKSSMFQRRQAEVTTLAVQRHFNEALWVLRSDWIVKMMRRARKQRESWADLCCCLIVELKCTKRPTTTSSACINFTSQHKSALSCPTKKRKNCKFKRDGSLHTFFLPHIYRSWLERETRHLRARQHHRMSFPFPASTRSTPNNETSSGRDVLSSPSFPPISGAFATLWRVLPSQCGVDSFFFPMLLLLLQRSMFIQILCFVEKRAAARQPRTFARLWQRASNQHHTALQLGVNYKSNIIIFFFSCKRATAPTTVHRLSVYHHRLHGPTSQSTSLLSREKRKEKKKIIKNFCCCPMCKLKV